MNPKTKTALLIIAATCVFLALEYGLYAYIDRPLALYTSIMEVTRPELIGFFKSITDLGLSAWYLWPCGLATIFCGFLSRAKDLRQPYRRLCAYIGVRAFFLFGTIALSGIAADIIKPIIGRARPKLWLHDAVYGCVFFHTGGAWASMPSGHSTTVFTLAFALSVLYPRLRLLWLAYATLLAASRIMVDAHYLSDVVAGGVLGWLTVKLFIRNGMLHGWKIIFPIDKPALKR